jgi:hypothetical protein
MKISKHLAVGLLIISLAPVWGQTTLTINNSQPTTLEATNLTKFNLDFAGGPPELLVKAIEKATGKPLNVIIPTEDADVDLPPLKMNDVVVPQLFAALEQASLKQVAVVTSTFGGGGRSGPSSYSTFVSGYGFKTSDEASDNSIWYFHVEKPSLPPAVSSEKICEFYPLSSYLESGFTVDDITTAIQTGWKMAGITSPPELNYHKETKLLIAFGEPNELKTIDDVLKALQPQLPSPTFNDRLQDIIHKAQQSSVAPSTTPQRMPPLPKSPENSLPENNK